MICTDAHGRWRESPVHAAFGLSYAGYLAVPRVLLEAMPYEWQERLVTLMEEFEDTFRDYEPPGGYEVHAKDARGRFMVDQLRNYRHPDPMMIERLKRVS